MAIYKLNNVTKMQLKVYYLQFVQNYLFDLLSKIINLCQISLLNTIYPAHVFFYKINNFFYRAIYFYILYLQPINKLNSQ